MSHQEKVLSVGNDPCVTATVRVTPNNLLTLRLDPINSLERHFMPKKRVCEIELMATPALTNPRRSSIQSFAHPKVGVRY